MRPIFPAINGSACNFTVWSPLCERIDLVILHPYHGICPMSRDGEGYWTISVEGVMEGTRYMYRIDGASDYPDPASLSQPEGVHGPSEVIDLQNFRWSDHSWKNIREEEMIFYELHTGTFSGEGTFKGISDRLDYLIDLGVNTIELMPVAQFPGRRNWGYDGAYAFAVQNSYGGAAELMKLVNTCHNRGVAVVLDVVYNHIGPEGNYLGQFAPYFSDRYRTPWGKAINFDGSYSDGVRNYFLQNALMWLEYFHIDGLRLDAVHAVFDFGAKHIMKELAETVNVINSVKGRKHYLIAESALNDTKYINSFESGGYGLDMQWNDDFHHGLHALVTGEGKGYYEDFTNPDMFLKAFSNGFAYDGRYSAHRKKKFGSPSIDNPASQFIVYSQNHDQTGNRKSGERLSVLVGFEMLKVIAGAVFVSPYIPLIFMGEEYGESNPFLYFVDHSDRKLNNLVRKGRQAEFRDLYSNDNLPVPVPSSIKTFRRSILRKKPLSKGRNAALFDYYKFLIKLKKRHPVLKSHNKYRMILEYSGKLLSVERWHGENRIIAFLNFSSEDRKCPLPASFNENTKLLLDSSDSRWNGPGGETHKDLSGRTHVISKESISIFSV